MGKYVRIEFTNCNLDYESTVCEFKDIDDHLESIKSDFEIFKEGDLPSVIIYPIKMTDEEYEQWFIKYIEPTM